jgi:hypothetical protein
MKRVSWRPLIGLLMLAFAVRLAAGWAWQSRLEGRFGMGDTESYWVLGKAIAEGQPYEYGDNRAKVFRTPGCPILLAPIFWIAGDGRAAVMLARAEAALLATLAVLAVWWLTRLLFDDRAALWAAALAAFYPGAIVLGALILSEAPFCPLMLLQLGLWAMAWKAASWRRRTVWGLLAGLAAGAATLMRPSWLLFTPFAIGVGLFVGLVHDARTRRATGKGTEMRASQNSRGPTARRRSGEDLRRPLPPNYLPDRDGRVFPRHVLIATAMLLGLVVAMLPWWIRNVRVSGCFVATTLQTGASLYDGLSPEATGASNMDFVKRYQQEQREASTGDAGKSPEQAERELDRRMRDDALAWARANPGRALHLAGVKLLRLWNVWPNEPALTGRWFVCWGVFFTYTPLLILAIIGAWRTIGRGWPYILCWLPAVYLTMLHVVFVSSIRYREPAMLALLALAAGAGWRRGEERGMKDEG